MKKLSGGRWLDVVAAICTPWKQATLLMDVDG